MGKGMVYGGEVFTLSVDKRDEPFDIFICHAGDFAFVINRKQCYLNRVIFVLNNIVCDNTIALILNVKRISVRTMRFRIKRKEISNQ